MVYDDNHKPGTHKGYFLSPKNSIEKIPENTFYVFYKGKVFLHKSGSILSSEGNKYIKNDEL